MRTPKHVAFVGGGSGGHLFPAIAIADALLKRSPDTQLTFLTSQRPIDQRVIQACGLPTDRLRHVTLPLTSSTRKIVYGIKAATSFVKCRSEFDRNRPDVVIGLGGFASVSGAVAAAWLKIPLVLVETNAVPGAANRYLNRFAATTFTGWPMNDDDRQAWRSKIHQVGVPVRRQFTNIVRLPSAAPQLLVLGGSQGAVRVNELAVHAVQTCSDVLSGWKIIHQTGANHAARVSAEYQKSGATVAVVGFIENMSQVLSESDVVISRSGAVTLAELAAAGCASILIPLSHSADDHQQANAQIFCDANASRHVDERSADAFQQLADAITELCGSAQTRANLSESAKSLAVLDAADQIVDWIS